MSGQIIGQLAGQIIGGIVAGPVGAAIGGAVGGAVGSSFDSLPTQYGPRLDDLRVQKSEYGAPIPIVYGTVGIQGNVIWAADIKEVQSETEQGGKGGPSQTAVTYSYLGSFAILLCEGEIGGVGRIWAGPAKRLIWDGTNLESGSMRVYLGTEDQEPDPLIEQHEGIGNVPAYRGHAYIVIEDFELSKDGNTLPFLTIEVGASSGDSCPVPVLQANGKYLSEPAPKYIGHQPDAKQIFHDAKTGMTYWTRQSSTGAWTLNRMDLSTGETGPELTLAASGNLKIVWDDNGGAQYLVWGQPEYHMVDLTGWQVITGLDTTIKADFPDGSGTVSMPIPLADIAYIGNGQYGYLSLQNAVNTFGTAVNHAGIYPVPAQYTWGSVGERTGGTLTSMGVGAAASFDLQPSNYSTKPTQWDLFIGGGHNVLMSFGDAAYSQGGSFIEMSAPTFGNIQASVYDPVRDMVYAWEDGLGLVAYDPDKLTPTSWPREECVYFDGRKDQVYDDGQTPIDIGTFVNLAILPSGEVAVTTWPDGDIFRVNVANKIGATGVLLSEVVADLSERAGESRYDFSALASDVVDGYAIARQTTVRAAIDVLRPVYSFDLVESQGIIKGVKRGTGPITEIDDVDLAAHDAGSEAPDPLETVRRMEHELPRAVNIKYLSAATDYSQAAKPARRLIGASGDELTLDVPLVLSDTKAQEVAEIVLHTAWAERISYRLSLPRKYSELEPTDRVRVKGRLMRLTKDSTTPRGVRSFEALADESVYFAPHVIVTETPPNDGTVSQPSTTLMELF